MTINWGNKLLIVFALFGTMIIILVYKAVHSNYDLVSKEYYKDELNYQQIIDGTNRANGLTTALQIKQQQQQINIQLPVEMKGVASKGTILFYCASDSRKDKQFDLKVNAAGNQQINAMQLLPGNYQVKISWQAKGKNYYSQQSFIVN
jgi:nitrogen fixation protein FixH